MTDTSPKSRYHNDSDISQLDKSAYLLAAPLAGRRSQPGTRELDPWHKRVGKTDTCHLRVGKVAVHEQRIEHPVHVTSDSNEGIADVTKPLPLTVTIQVPSM